jgi:PAS domain S-box-containing protein
MSNSYRDLVFKEAREQTELIAELEKSFERALAQIRYQALLLNNVRDAVVVWNLDGKITYTNPAALRLFGWSMEKWLTAPVEEFFSLFTPRVRVPGGEGTGGLRVERSFTKQDSTIWVSSHVYALRDHSSNGKLIGYMDVCRDITERKQMEARVQAAQIQLIQAARLAAIAELDRPSPQQSTDNHHRRNPAIAAATAAGAARWACRSRLPYDLFHNRCSGRSRRDRTCRVAGAACCTAAARFLPAFNQ